MDLKGGMPWWLMANRLEVVAPALECDTSCDVAVIGAGITGALVASALVDEGRDVVVLDRRELAQGSTIASTALLQYDLDVPLHQLGPKIGWEKAGRAFRAGIDAIEAAERIGASIGCPVERVPSFYAATRPDLVEPLREEFECRRRHGLSVRWLEAEELLTSWNVQASAAILSTDAAQLDPYHFTTALLADARRRGVRLYDRTDVSTVSWEEQGVTLRTTTGATVRARWLVRATGYEAARDLPARMVELRSTYALATEPIPGAASAPRFMFWEMGDPYLYARWAGDRLLIGGEDVSFTNERRRDRLIERTRDVLIGKMQAIFPAWRLEPAFAWTGTFATTSDGLGFIGDHPRRPCESFALGFGGNGITFSVIASWIIASAVMGRDHPLADLFRLDR